MSLLVKRMRGGAQRSMKLQFRGRQEAHFEASFQTQYWRFGTAVIWSDLGKNSNEKAEPSVIQRFGGFATIARRSRRQMKRRPERRVLAFRGGAVEREAGEAVKSKRTMKQATSREYFVSAPSGFEAQDA